MFQYRVNMASPQPSAQRACSTVAQIVNPDPKPPKVSAAADVLHYFELINKQKVCKECTHDSDRECTTLGGIKTRQTVSSFVLWFEISHLPHKLEYRERARAEGQSAPATPAVGTGETPQYMSLAHQYGYDDDMNFGGSNDAEQTVDHQEYQAYVTTPLSSNQIDTLKFWEVSNVINSVSGTDRLCRSTPILSPPFLQWQWTTSPFKRLLSLANVYFLQVPKPIQCQVIYLRTKMTTWTLVMDLMKLNKLLTRNTRLTSRPRSHRNRWPFSNFGRWAGTDRLL